MIRTDNLIRDEALDWLVRVNDPAFDGWDAFEAWLAADARHADVYWALAAAEQDAVDLEKSAPQPIRRRPVVRSARLNRRLAVAASVVLMAGGALFTLTQTPQPWRIETGPGEMRTVRLLDGSHVTLDGTTRLVLDRRRPREVELVAGRALFDVAHDDTDPFRVQVGETALTDLGTVFDVTRLRDGTRVSVSEGRVEVSSAAGRAVLDAGDGVLVTARGLEQRPVPIDAVESWREGRLTYAGEPLVLVAGDLARRLGHTVTVSDDLAGRRFTGSVRVGGPPDALRERLSVLLGVAIVETGGGWRLEPPSPS